ncbi:MAG: hypothetical protein CTY27_06605 [Methylotenera sp.]|nr:MAG: hypothetical protein CTY27_06605 [Methylotenera sp.]
MKLLNRLREMREEQTEEEYAPDEHSFYAFENAEEPEDDYLDTIGVGTTTIDDIIRLNVEHRNLQMSLYATA